MSAGIDSIRNLGPKSVTAFARAGLHTADQVRALGADAAYRALIKAGTRPHFIGYYALVLGLQGRPWNDLPAEEKAALRLRFDALVAEVGAKEKGRSEMEAALDAFGVRDAARDSMQPVQPTSSSPEKK